MSRTERYGVHARAHLLSAPADGGGRRYLVARRPERGWQLERVVHTAPGSGVPLVAWRRRLPERRSAVTTGDVPALPGEWALDFVFTVERPEQLAPVLTGTARSLAAGDEAAQLQDWKRSFLRVLTILDAAQVQYWADSGTLLGALRHRGIIPWDRDADIGVLRADAGALLEALRPHEDEFYLHQAAWHRTAVHPARQALTFANRVRAAEEIIPGQLFVMSTRTNRHVCDVFTFVHDRFARPKFWYDRREAAGIDIRQGFLMNDAGYWRRVRNGRGNVPWSLMFPLRRVPFYDRDIPVPRDAAAVLKGTYGDGCLTRRSRAGFDSEGEAVTDFTPL